MRSVRRWGGGAVVILIVLGLAAGEAAAQGKPLQKVRFLFAGAARYVAFAPTTVAKYLGFFEEEGLDVDILGVAGSAAALQQLVAGQVEFAAPSPEPVITGREKGLKAKYVYLMYRKNIYSVAVPADGPLKGWADLKGKTLGVQSLASGAVPMVKAMLQSAGMRSDDVTFVAVGQGAQAATVLKTGKVDGLALWDAEYATSETLGLKFRFLTTPEAQRLFSNGIVVREDYLRQHPEVIVGAGRAQAKGTVFVLENPELAVRIHWKVFPESKPTGVDEAKAIQDQLHILKARLANFDFKPEDKLRKWGYMFPEEWQAFVDFMLSEHMISTKIPASDLYTNQFIDQMNQFDAGKIRELARTYKLK